MDTASAQVSFGETIRRERRTRQLRLRDLAASAQISASHLSRIENGRLRPTQVTIAKLAHALHADNAEYLRLAGRTVFTVFWHAVPHDPKNISQRDPSTDPELTFEALAVSDPEHDEERTLRKYIAKVARGLSNESLTWIVQVMQRLSPLNEEQQHLALSIFPDTKTMKRVRIEPLIPITEGGDDVDPKQ